VNRLYGGLEAGGTKFACLIGSGPDEIVAETRFPTTQPGETIRRAIQFFEPFARRGELAGIGIAAFGPLDLDPASPTFGRITTTPKPGWEQTDLHGAFRQALDLPVAIDTDVNAAAFGEYFWEAESRALDPFLYLTVGTGVGAGVLVGGRPLHGLVHPEGGHLAVPHDWQNDPFPGVCPYHGDCLEGLASGPAMARRWGCPAEALPARHPAWELESGYIALALANFIYAYSPRRIVLGGGVAQHAGFHAAVRRKVRQRLNGYIHSPLVGDRIDAYIVRPAYGNRSGVLGAIALANAQERPARIPLPALNLLPPRAICKTWLITLPPIPS
jgi:fructokinase